jgi:hypothetical protein
VYLRQSVLEALSKQQPRPLQGKGGSTLQDVIQPLQFESKTAAVGLAASGATDAGSAGSMGRTAGTGKLPWLDAGSCSSSTTAVDGGAWAALNDTQLAALRQQAHNRAKRDAPLFLRDIKAAGWKVRGVCAAWHRPLLYYCMLGMSSCICTAPLLFCTPYHVS